MLAVISFVAFAVATVWFGVTRAWPMALTTLGLALWVLADTGPIRIG